ncbi:MAG: cardiolipin synthase [Lachnospiraceae bacterium]|nr:cardiolipin synthase [Lachnospiraceae bacterium]
MAKKDRVQHGKMGNSAGRIIFALLALIGQIGWFWMLALTFLQRYTVPFTILASLISLGVAVRMVYRERQSSIKISWLMVILSFPILGLVSYLLLGRPNATKRLLKRFQNIDREILKYHIQNPQALEELSHEDRLYRNQLEYIRQYAPAEIHHRTKVTYYGEAVNAWKNQIEDAKKARHYIFIEIHAIEFEGAFEELYQVLVERARAGVCVRIIYDDIGSGFFINRKFNERCQADGIECRVFNPVKPILNLFLNNRDHRKITVIDGVISYTGGYNFANEYFNITHPYGYWKDAGIRMEGGASLSLTAMFLEMWNFIKETKEDYSRFHTKIGESILEGKENSKNVDSLPTDHFGYVEPYLDNPLDHERVGENVYLNMINNAKDFIYIMTPYFIISDEMTRAISLAAKRGVDVRIITPGIPDKKITYAVTRSYYGGVVSQGARVYEYTPGFCHAKLCVVDGILATVGTINFDYRSLYHHFENGVLLYRCDAIADIVKDLEEAMEVSTEVTQKVQEDLKNRRMTRVSQGLLRLIAPML